MALKSKRSAIREGKIMNKSLTEKWKLYQPLCHRSAEAGCYLWETLYFLTEQFVFEHANVVYFPFIFWLLPLLPNRKSTLTRVVQATALLHCTTSLWNVRKDTAEWGGRWMFSACLTSPRRIRAAPRPGSGRCEAALRSGGWWRLTSSPNTCR